MLDRYGTDEQKAMIDGSITPASIASPWFDRARARLRRDPYGNASRSGDARQRQGLARQRPEDVGPRACMSRPIARCSPAPRARMGDARGITCLLVPRKPRASRSRSTCGPSTCRPTHPRVSFTDVFVPDDALFGEVGRGLSRRSVSCTRTGSGRRRVRWALRVYCINESVKYARERKRSARRWPRTRRSSGRWWSWRRRPRCCGC